jgi:HEPN domain-containing protein
MTPDQLRLDEVRGWLERARRDLRAARLLIAGDAYAEALFHCQQAVEKAGVLELSSEAISKDA